MGDFAISGHGGQTTMTYRIPASKTFDFVKDSNAAACPDGRIRKAIGRTARNQSAASAAARTPASPSVPRGGGGQAHGTIS